MDHKRDSVGSLVQEMWVNTTVHVLRLEVGWKQVSHRSQRKRLETTSRIRLAPQRRQHKVTI